MAEQAFSCQNPGRRQLLLEQTAPPGSRLDAIDYLVVVDGDGVPAAIAQRLLLVRLVFGDAVGSLNPGTVQIRGGVRVRTFDIRWALPLSQVTALAGPANDPAL